MGEKLVAVRASVVVGLSLAAPVAALVALTAAAAPAAPPEHELRTGGPVELAVGARAAASLTIVPAAGHRLAGEAPVSLRLGLAPDGVAKVAKRRYALADAADPRAEAPRFDLAVEGLAAGQATLTVEARFWVCAARTCRPVRDRVDIPIVVRAPAADAGP